MSNDYGKMRIKANFKEDSKGKSFQGVYKTEQKVYKAFILADDSGDPLVTQDRNGNSCVYVTLMSFKNQKKKGEPI